MPATVKPVTVDGTCICGKKVAVEVFTALSASRGLWCRKCADQLRKELDAKAAPKKGKD